jgi:hypothetical protein
LDIEIPEKFGKKGFFGKERGGVKHAVIASGIRRLRTLMVRSVAQRRVSNHEARAFPHGGSRARILRATSP